ncbi:uncharacterized protein FMAN_03797 [Fusarium mangiferae]|uniref:Uncharacterized protein n=1 Tax=Fusarium mangiferae TaxID=192010 RepID=A0A1L7UAU2_FUSMA|nr:uncharacterized protein FMAN_03797 [Fusarium mangiferae]CVL06252.1 uncharacterized protein FMAN_03797 [Fusarium mangiferae]
MSSYYFDTTTDEQKYKENAKGAQKLLELTVSSGSRWGGEHLKACHVVVNSKVGDCLPLLKSYDRTIRKTFERGKGNTHIAAFIQDLAPKHENMRQHALVREPEVGASLARFWAALRDVKKLKSDEEKQESKQRTSGRVRTQTTHAGYVNSELIASSSQGHEDSPNSSFSTSTSSYTPAQRPATQLPVELYTVELAFAAINHILLYTQDPSLDTPVEIRQPERWSIQITNKRITAIDDGGLTLIKNGGEKTGKSVVLIEAKRRLNVCDKTDRPSVPDEQLGQMACEAIAARSSMQGDKGSDDIFLINATQHYMCFFHFNITADHLEDLGHGRIPDNAIKVTTTRWFNLESPTGRKCIVKNVLQLAEYMGQMEGEEKDPLPLPDL